MSIGVLNALNSPSPRILETQKAFWQHSFASATCAESIAKAKGLPKKDIETIFIGGLLHDVGRLFLFTLFNLPYMEVLKESINRGEHLESVEARILGVTHAQLGGILAEKWNFPEGLIEMISQHDIIPDGTVPKDGVFCAHIADAIANELAPKEIVGTPSPVDAKARLWLGFNEDQYEGLKQKTAEQVALAKDMLGVM
jgi:HD-like signal output (HDOD) protein